MIRFLKCAWLFVVLFSLSVQDALACSVCFGDPNSSLVHGAKAGVAVLLAIVALVLGGILAVAVFWIRRARLLRVQAAMRGESVNL